MQWDSSCIIPDATVHDDRVSCSETGSCIIPDATVHDDRVSASNFKSELILYSVGPAVYLNVHLPAATRNDYILHNNVITYTCTIKLTHKMC